MKIRKDKLQECPSANALKALKATVYNVDEKTLSRLRHGFSRGIPAWGIIARYDKMSLVNTIGRQLTTQGISRENGSEALYDDSAYL